MGAETMAAFRTVDPQSLPRHFDPSEGEGRWHHAWQEAGLYHWDENRPREETFVVDTPPPTASGSLHIGHVFSYSHTDILVRYQRMRGRNIYYPLGWDDNGVPTERRVQNLFHVRCDPTLPHDPELALEPASAKVRKKPPLVISRKNFLDLCAEVTAEDEKAFLELFAKVGLSVDWRTEYATIDARCRTLAQRSFLDLHDKGHTYTVEAPFMWDVDFQMALSQADVEDKMRPGAYHDIEFAVDGSDRSFVISTTRPELLGACVGVTAHPDDERFQDLFGQTAITPLFHAPVPIFASDKADPEKGTGILMVCTFGDQTDVEWWREQGLALRQLLGKNGRLRQVTFGDDEFPSRDADRANAVYAEIAGKNVEQARKRIAELLEDPAHSATGNGPPLQSPPRPIEHAVKFYEKGDRPLEILPSRQWFVRLLDKKDALLQKGSEIAWHPPHMESRFRDWTENLSLDWCVSRQRYFGVPIPVWYPLDAHGEPDYDTAIVATPDQMPVDPMTDVPAGYTEAQRNQPGGFAGEADIFDTWFTSSMTPQIGSGWVLDPARHKKLFPADIRPQSHEIIRTWAFYTIAKAMLHEDSVPWHHVNISGWILDPDRKKMSKSLGNVVTPLPLLEEFSADAVRYWAANARLGVDTALDESVFKIGKKLITKLWNASKFVLSQEGQPGPITNELDRAFLRELRTHVEQATKDAEAFDLARTLQDTERFFWSRFTDTYLELAKTRARDEGDPAGRDSAVTTLRFALSVLLRMFAPVLPYVTEEIWSWIYGEERGEPFIHGAAWPTAAEFDQIEAPADSGSFDLAITALAAINKAKADAEVSMGREVEHLELAGAAETMVRIEPVLSDVLLASRCHGHAVTSDDGIDVGSFQVRDARFAPRPDKK